MFFLVFKKKNWGVGSGLMVVVLSFILLLLLLLLLQCTCVTLESEEMVLLICLMCTFRASCSGMIRSSVYDRNRGWVRKRRGACSL